MEGVEGDSQWEYFNNQASQKPEEMLEEAQDQKIILQVSLRPPPFSTALKMEFPELCRKFRCARLSFLLLDLQHSSCGLFLGF